MIEYRYIGEEYNWCHLNICSDSEGSHFNFEGYQIRLDGIIYTKNTKEFRDAFKRLHLWNMLTND